MATRSTARTSWKRQRATLVHSKARLSLKLFLASPVLNCSQIMFMILYVEARPTLSSRFHQSKSYAARKVLVSPADMHIDLL